MADAVSSAAASTTAIRPTAGFDAAAVAGVACNAVRTLAVLSALPALPGARRVARSQGNGRDGRR